MAAEHSDYVHGTMPVNDHRDTFGGFMSTTRYGGALIALVVVMPTLVFGTALTWLPALIITMVLGIVLGVALKLKGGWYAGIIGLGIFTAVICALLSALT